MAGGRATTAMFKPVSGGYVFRAPSPWIFWRRRFYLVNETQKAELLSIIAARVLHRARGYIFLIALVGLIFSATMIVAYASGHREPTARDAIVLLGLLPFCLYGALVISILPIALRLRPILAGLPAHPPVSFLDWGRSAPASATSETESESVEDPTQEQLEEQLLEQIDPTNCGLSVRPDHEIAEWEARKSIASASHSKSPLVLRSPYLQCRCWDSRSVSSCARSAATNC